MCSLCPLKDTEENREDLGAIYAAYSSINSLVKDDANCYRSF